MRSKRAALSLLPLFGLGLLGCHSGHISTLNGEERVLASTQVADLDVAVVVKTSGYHSERDFLPKDLWSTRVLLRTRQAGRSEELFLGQLVHRAEQAEALKLFGQVGARLCVDSQGRFPRVGVALDVPAAERPMTPGPAHARYRDKTRPVYLFGDRILLGALIDGQDCAATLATAPSSEAWLAGRLAEDRIATSPDTALVDRLKDLSLQAWVVAIREGLLIGQALSWAMGNKELVHRITYDQREPFRAEVATLAAAVAKDPALRQRLLAMLGPKPDPNQPNGGDADQVALKLLAATPAETLRPALLALLAQWGDPKLLAQTRAWGSEDIWRFRAVARLAARLDEAAVCDRLLDVATALEGAKLSGGEFLVRDPRKLAEPCATPKPDHR